MLNDNQFTIIRRSDDITQIWAFGKVEATEDQPFPLGEFDDEIYEQVVDELPGSYQIVERLSLAQLLERDFLTAIMQLSSMDPIPVSAEQIQGMYFLKNSITEMLKSAEKGIAPEFHILASKSAIQAFPIAPEQEPILGPFKASLLSRFQ